MINPDITKSDMLHFLAYLIRIKETEIIKFRNLGICGNINANYEVLSEYFKIWKYFSGATAYPIPDLCNGPVTAFHTCNDKWDKSTEYGQLRWDLVDHLIECITKDLEELCNDSN